jgi:fructosamine-3-kinase
MEDLEPARPAGNYWPRFGRELAALHNHMADRFGFAHNNFIGSTPQPNAWMEDGYTFFAEHRLVFQARLAELRGYLAASEAKMVERLASRLHEWVPPQPASLLHGDLWTGNAICDAQGAPAIIDPAAYYGWAEAELGMTTLFGSFPDAFYRAYEEVRPLEAGWLSRLDLYNLYHLLNHLNMFGGSYYGSVMGSIRRFISK